MQIQVTLKRSGKNSAITFCLSISFRSSNCLTLYVAQQHIKCSSTKMEVIVHLKLSKKNVLRFKHTAILPVHIVSIFGNAIELLAWYGNVHRHSS